MIKIYFDKRKVRKSLFISAFLLMGSILIVTSGEPLKEYSLLMTRIIGWGGVVMFSLLVIAEARSYTKKEPAIIIDNAGIHYTKMLDSSCYLSRLDVLSAKVLKNTIMLEMREQSRRKKFTIVPLSSIIYDRQKLQQVIDQKIATVHTTL